MDMTYVSEQVALGLPAIRIFAHKPTARRYKDCEADTDLFITPSMQRKAEIEQVLRTYNAD